MPRGACTFRQRDMKAAVKAVVDAGCEVLRVEVDRVGTIIVHTTKSKSADAETSLDNRAEEGNEWDRV